MWKKIEERFAGLPVQRAIARKMAEYGLSVSEDGRISCGSVEIKENSLAKSVGSDRRAVRETVKTIMRDKYLKQLFRSIKPAGALLKEVAHLLNFGVVEIEGDAKKAGIISDATALLSKNRISIRQIYADDPEMIENPKLTIIAERKIPGTLLNALLKIKGVRKVSIY